METRIRQKIIVVVGPTASGKTALAIHLAKRFSGEVISADSRQIYRGMNIGTAKPKLVKKGKAFFSEGVRHYLMNVRDINQPFSAKDFKTLAERAIRDIAKRKKLPVIVGGTGLYVKTLVENLNLTATPPNPRLRRKLEKDLKTRGLPYLYSKLVELDAEAAYIVDPKNPRRVIRALEVAITNKKPLKQTRTKNKPRFDFLEIGIECPRDKLKKKIEDRVSAMVKSGLIGEVRYLIQKYGSSPEPLSAIGYREVIAMLEKKIPMEDAIRQMQTNTWRYAKKQIAWFRKDLRVNWIKNKKEAELLAKKFLTATAA